MWVADHSRYRYSISKAYEPDELVGCLFLWCRILVINLQDSISFGGRENVTEVSLSCVRFAINSSFPIVSFGRPHKKTVSKGCRFVVAPVMFARVSWNWNPRHHQRYQRLSCWESTRNGVGRSPRKTAWQHGPVVAGSRGRVQLRCSDILILNHADELSESAGTTRKPPWALLLVWEILGIHGLKRQNGQLQR